MSLYTYDGNIAINMDSIYNGKKISLLGDSITTYVGYIPSGQTYEYTGSNHGISSVNDTWWKKLINALGMELVRNNSWTGTCVSTIRDSVKGTNSNAVVRSELLGNNPDVIILYMGINDFCFEAPLGDYEGLTSVPDDICSLSISTDGLAYDFLVVFASECPRITAIVSIGTPSLYQPLARVLLNM